jgi:hypothetical protein
MDRGTQSAVLRAMSHGTLLMACFPVKTRIRPGSQVAPFDLIVRVGAVGNSPAAVA